MTAVSTNPRRSTTDARIVRTREALHAAMLRLLERRPLDQITIREITAAAGVGYATFFRHHASKDALLEDLVTEQIETLVARTLPIFDATDTRASCLALCSYVASNRALWTALLTGGAAGRMREEFIWISRKIADDRRDTVAWLPVDLGVLHSSSAIVGILAWWLCQADPPPSEQVAMLIDRLVISPLGTP